MTNPSLLTLLSVALSAAISLAQEAAPETPQDTVYLTSLAALKDEPGATEIERAISALSENARTGHEPSELLLAQAFYLGSKVIPQDYKRAFPHVRAMALRNHPWSMNAFASMHEFGQGTERNAGTAFGWYRLAAEIGHPRAMANLGRILITRPASSQDHIEGCAWLYLSREMKDGIGATTLREIEPKLPAANLQKIEARLSALRSHVQQKAPDRPGKRAE